VRPSSSQRWPRHSGGTNGWSPIAHVRLRALIGPGAAVVVIASVVVAVTMRPNDHAGPCLVIGAASLSELPEASGLAVSRRHAGLVWSHNDSGGEAMLFGLDASGAVRARARIPVRAQDWEDVSAGRCGDRDCLYVADIGDNRASRRNGRIHRLPEPALGDTSTGPPETFTAVYADGPHNAEALFVIGDDLYIVTRDRIAALYRATVSAPSHDLSFQRVGQLGLAAVTDAETSRDGRSVVVRTSHEAVFYRTGDVAHGHLAPYYRFAIDGLKEPQGEGIALDGARLYLASEGRPWNRAGRLLTLRCILPDQPGVLPD
jgi:hypothetical protein